MDTDEPSRSALSDVQEGASASQECLRTPAELKAWMVSARRSIKPKLTQRALAVRLQLSGATICLWESKFTASMPSRQDVEAIARACRTTVPTLDLELRSTRNTNTNKRKPYVQPIATDLAMEILETGRALAFRCFGNDIIERNAQIFFSRYGRGLTLNDVGEIHSMTRERVRQIVDKMLDAMRLVTPRQECFLCLAEACEDIDPEGLGSAESRLSSLLGEGVGLQAAMDYGVQVLGTSLPIRIIPQTSGDPLVTGKDRAAWLPIALSHARRLIRFHGAALLPMVWAATQSDISEKLTLDELTKTLVESPGFEWLEESHHWFWFGLSGYPNRMVEWAVDILAVAGKPLDIEVIYAGIARYRHRPEGQGWQAPLLPSPEVLLAILKACPDIQCQQGDDLRLVPNATVRDEQRSQVTEQILRVLRESDGLASRRELIQALVDGQGVNNITLAVQLATSPLLRQLDRSIYAIRGWAVDPQRLLEAAVVVRTFSNSIGVTRGEDGSISWEGVLTAGSIRNRLMVLPAAASEIADGLYSRADGGSVKVLTIGTWTRVNRGVRALRDMGAQAGDLFRVTFWAGTSKVQFDLLPPLSIGHTANIDDAATALST